MKTEKLKDSEPCSVGCLHHATHPCEKCGRIAGRGEYEKPTGLEFKQDDGNYKVPDHLLNKAYAH